MANLAWTVEIQTKRYMNGMQEFLFDVVCQGSVAARSYRCMTTVVVTMVNHVHAHDSITMDETKFLSGHSDEKQHLSKPLEKMIPSYELMTGLAAKSSGWCNTDDFYCFKVYLSINPLNFILPPSSSC